MSLLVKDLGKLTGGRVPLQIWRVGPRRTFAIYIAWKSHVVVKIERTRGESLGITFFAHDPGAN